MTADKNSWVQEMSQGCLQIDVDIRLYTLEALFRACYAFTDRCYLFLSMADDQNVVTVRFSPKTADCDLVATAGEFSNDLINQKIRSDIAHETKEIRELIVAQAFTEADLLDRSASEANYLADPRGIGIAK